MRRNRSERLQTLCSHERTVSTVSAGIARIACERCGHVQVRHHHDLVVAVDRKSFQGESKPLVR